MIRVHVAHHHPVLREAVANDLAREPDLTVVGRGRAGEDGTRDIAGPRADVIVLCELGGGDLAELVARYRAAAPGAKVVLLREADGVGEATAVADAVRAAFG